MKSSDNRKLKVLNGIVFFQIPELEDFGWISHAFLGRRGGTSLQPFDSLNLGRKNGDRAEHIIQNYIKVSETFGFDPRRLLLLDQIHSDRILVIGRPEQDFNAPLEYDAAITDVSDLFLGILTADCLPIFIVDRRKRLIAAIHAGRQGTGLRITEKVMEKMSAVFRSSPEDLLVGIGPGIGPCCYEIDASVFMPEWHPFVTPKDGSRWMFDLAEANIAQILSFGVRKEKIFRIDLCTCCEKELFFSYRREKVTGRQLSFIGMK